MSHFEEQPPPHNDVRDDGDSDNFDDDFDDDFEEETDEEVKELEAGHDGDFTVPPPRPAEPDGRANDESS